MSRQLVIAGNWKMYKTRSEARQLAKQIVSAMGPKGTAVQVVLCPPYTSLEAVGSVIHDTEICLGAQNMYYQEAGAFTGEIAPAMLSELGVSYVIIGHSERRQYFNETDETVNCKLKAALRHKFCPIVCVGETPAQREQDLTDEVVSSQVKKALDGLNMQELSTLMIAYEPIWAIGTGKICAATEANRVAKLIRQTVGKVVNDGAVLAERLPILYGGSVKPSNVDEQLKQSDIDGSLVGGASLSAQEFVPIIQAAQKALETRLQAHRI